MIDIEVSRLRALRSMALRARALAAELNSPHDAHHEVLAKTAVLCWTVSRVASGQLRSHPYLSYQQDPTAAQEFVIDSAAFGLATLARFHGRRLGGMLAQLQQLERKLADCRALTRTPDLSDALGRVQRHLQRLLSEIQCAARDEPGAAPAQLARVEQRRPLADAAPSDWPYLAI